ncbi:hypothetical protein FOMG_02360 [Fusarium oxysporum f. sp. melonis 26406]|uniref:Metalloendopeptidase n=1 Tax=Fusarium oxysporum f. sp. melonis 26406 TaxID=1089452 RepID=X0BYC4_FUSOX|nr:hypothetical protein FOMG_02360 [Fusarium oxysporum f. sp. melonis 26406]
MLKGYNLPFVLFTGLSTLFSSCDAAGRNTSLAEDLTGFGNNLTTINIEYQVWAGCGPPENLTTVRRRVAYVVVNGLAVIDGDVVYGTEGDILADRVADSLTKRSLSNRAPGGRWPNAIVPYSWSDEDVSPWLSDADKSSRMKLFEEAAKVWMDRLPWLHIIHITTPYDPKATTPAGRITVQFVKGGTSSSPLGRAERQDWSYISLGEPYLSTYVHEIGHTLGLQHEHKRPDRDQYFNLDCSALMDDEKGVAPVCTSEDKCQGWGCQFTALVDPLVYNFEGPYDTSSVMHYFERSAAKDFSSQPLTGIKPGVRVGRTSRPTLMDLLRVCNMYQLQCAGRGICGDGILSPANGEECDPGCGTSDTCTEDCKLKPVCGNRVVEAGEECDDGPAGSATCTTSCKKKPVCGNGLVEDGEECDDGASGSTTCTKDCKKITCIETCDPDPRFNKCDITTSCIKVEGGSAASAGKHYCACQGGFRAPSGQPQMRLPWFKPISQEGRVFVGPGQACNILCNAYTLGKDGCKEVAEQAVCY